MKSLSVTLNANKSIKLSNVKFNTSISSSSPIQRRVSLTSETGDILINKFNSKSDIVNLKTSNGGLSITDANITADNSMQLYSN